MIYLVLIWIRFVDIYFVVNDLLDTKDLYLYRCKNVFVDIGL